MFPGFNINDMNDINNMNMNNMNMNMNNMNMNNMNMNNMNMNNMNMNDMNMNYMNYMNNMNMNNINAGLLNAFLNMMMMNQNVMNNNQMDLNNMVNPNIFQMNQQNNNNFNHFQASRNQNEQSIIQNGGVMPRPNGVNNNKEQKGDLFPGYIGPRINIIFETGTGLKFNFPTPNNVPVSQLLFNFIRKVGVSDSLLGKKIFFIINGETIPINESSSVETYFTSKSYGLASNQIKIVVIDGNNVIGAINHEIYSYS